MKCKDSQIGRDPNTHDSYYSAVQRRASRYKQQNHLKSARGCVLPTTWEVLDWNLH